MRKKITVFTLCIILLFPSQVFAYEEYNILDLPTDSINNEKPIKIAIIDSGVINNELFYPYIHQGYNFLGNNENYIDTYGHGTRVTSILANLAKNTRLNIQFVTATP